MDVSAFEPGYFHDFDVSADGQRFLFIRAEPESRPTAPRRDPQLGSGAGRGHSGSDACERPDPRSSAHFSLVTLASW